MNNIIVALLFILPLLTNSSIYPFPPTFVQPILLPLLPFVLFAFITIRARIKKSILLSTLIFFFCIIIGLYLSSLSTDPLPYRVAAKYIVFCGWIVYFGFVVPLISRNLRLYTSCILYFCLINSAVVILQSLTRSIDSLYYLTDALNHLQNIKFSIKPNGLLSESSHGSILYLILFMPLYFSMLLRHEVAESPFTKPYTMHLTFILILVSSFLSDARTLLFGLPIFLLVFNYLKESLRIKVSPVSLIMSLLSLTLVSLVIIYFSPKFSLAEILLDSSLLTRSSLFLAGLKYSLAHPFSSGLGGFENNFQSYLPSFGFSSPEISVYLGRITAQEAYGYDAADYFIDTKNLILNFSTDFGSLPVLAICALYVFLLLFRLTRLRSAYLTYRRLSSFALLECIILFSQFGFLISTFFTASLALPFMALPLTLFLFSHTRTERI